MKTAETTIIGGSDGPTSVFIADAKHKHKQKLKHKLQRKCFELRKKWYALWIKPNPHTIEETAAYIRNKYGFIELSKGSSKYIRLYSELRSSFIMQYEPQLLGEYAVLPELKSQSADDVKEFLEQMQLRQEKASEISEDLFSLDYYYFEKEEKGTHMEIQLESRYEYIGGGSSGKNISKFDKMYKDVYRYYGVSEDDIKNHTKRYEDLLRTLSIRH